MAGQTSDELLALFDTARLNARYWAIFVIMSAIIVLEFFDFGIVAFLLAVVGPDWHLTYGQSATILYSGGVGSIIGALAFGAFSDARGRKTSIVVGTFICGIGAALNGLVPNGQWLLFAALRFIVGIGLTAAVVPALTIVVELTPTRHIGDELVYRVRHGWRVRGVIVLCRVARGDRLARYGDARPQRDACRLSGLGFRAGIGTLASCQGALC